ncbi:hypothetical protein [Cellvibrio sp. BR]|uniref:hypothetical protein n=1 Tax=Cellvibrio sp. BR TaxID=1134474 RepID=UPI00058BAF8E|nr:hypothetical protein [Cellvibrio sp. BR]
MSKYIILIFQLSFFLSNFAIASESNCGPAPYEPRQYCDNINDAVQRNDCFLNYEFAMYGYNIDLENWNHCRKVHNEWTDGEVLWVTKKERVCINKIFPIYGNNWFIGERSNIGGYDSGNAGWYCDEVFVPETIEQTHYYQDYNGSGPLCEAYLGNPIRTEPRPVCREMEIQVYVGG